MAEKKLKIFFIAMALFNLLILFAGSLSSSPFFWGFNTLSFFNFSGIIFFAVTGILIFVPLVNTAIMQGVEDLSSLINKPFVIPVLTITFLGFFFIFRIREHFLGDGPMILRMLPQMTGVSDMIATNEPGSYTLELLVQSLLRSIFGNSYTPEYVYIFLSIISGLAFIYILYVSSVFLSKDKSAAAETGILLLFTSNIIFFLGYVETYQVVFVLMFLYMILSVMYLGGKIKTTSSIALVFGVWLSLHYLAAVFLPSFVFILAYKFRKKMFASLISILIFIASFMAVYLLTGLDIEEMVKRFMEPNTSHWLPFFSSSDGVNPIFSVYHLWDVINSQLLALPFGLLTLAVLLILFRKTIDFKNPSVIFISLMCIGSFVFIFSFNSYLGLSRDWDVTALMSYPFLFFIILLINKFFDIAKVKRMYFIFAYIALWQVMIWVFANANVSIAEQRNTHLEDNRLWDKHRIALYYEEVGAYFRNKLDYDKAELYYEKGLKLEPDRERLITNLSYVYELQKKNEKAEKILEDYVEKGFGKKDIYFRLGVFQMASKKYEKAIENFKKILQTDPYDFETLGNISSCYYALKDYDKGIESSKMLVSLYPGMSKPYISLGDSYLGAGNNDSAMISYKKASELDTESKYKDEINKRIYSIKK
jgi:predicted negative regulator of RcsB-dependent stress response